MRDEQKVIAGFELILEGLGLDHETSEHLRDTPTRAAHAWFNELCGSLDKDPPDIKTFESDVDEMVVLRGIPIRSLCAHHLLPFHGHAVIAYIPGQGQILGLSKLSRIANYWARRPQVQEELTAQIANHVAKLVTSKATSTHPIKGGVGVIITARHLCMEYRGVHHAGEMITSALRGVLLTKPEARAELLHLAQ